MMNLSRTPCLYLALVLTSFSLYCPIAVWAFQATYRLPFRSLKDSTDSHDFLLASSVGREPRTTSTPLESFSSNNNDRGGSLTILGSSSSRSSGRLYKDVVIVGGGLAGLSAALHLSQLDPTRQITILEKSEMLASPTGSFAAAGMLAPQSERLPKGHYLDLCMASRRLFPDFCQQVERLAREAGDEGAPYLVQESEEKSNGLEPWNIGYVAAGGFLAPAFAGDSVATWAPPEETNGSAIWLDATQVRELEPNLSPKVVGGWWFPEDASVDARRLTGSLKAACVGAGVQFLCGDSYEVSSLDLENGNCNGLWLKTGKYIAAKAVLVANGAWMRTLLPVPIEPHKGQSLSLRMPKGQPPILRRVLFGQDSYIVPKADGRIVIGATVEAGSYDGKVTPAGIMHILSYAIDLVPELAELPLEETWAGLRPTTPDKGPILGETPWKGLFLAGGYWRNGVLLAPKTGELVASLIAGVPLSEEDKTYLKAFAWDRFTSPEGGAALAANARYAASLYPIHRRKSGAGVSAAVGTELGSYSTAAAAVDERRKDRESLFAQDGDDDAFERAAMMGKKDGTVFSFGGDKSLPRTSSSDSKDPLSTFNEFPPTPPALPLDPSKLKKSDLPHFLDLKADTEETKSDDQYADSQSDLSSVYKSVQENKAKQNIELEESTEDVRPDPPFRILHVDQETGERREVPPYTSPAEFLASIHKQSGPQSAVNGINEVAPTMSVEKETTKTYYGYQSIIEAAAHDNNIAETMRQARLKNRGLDTTPMQYPTVKGDPYVDVQLDTITEEKPGNDLSSVYDQIRQRKAMTENELSEAAPDARPDPGFRIYHIDPETGKRREVPPYTSPGDFLNSLEAEQLEPLHAAVQSSPLEVAMDRNGIPSLPKTPRTNGVTKSSPDPQAFKDSSGIQQPDEKTFDGYQDIIQSSSSLSQEAALDAMREARRKNRLGTPGVDESKLDL